MGWIIGSVIVCLISLIIFALYMRHKLLKDCELKERELSYNDNYGIYQQLDDICIKHHGGLPYEPD